MSVKEIQGDLFLTDAEAILDPCNCRGAKGAGLSKVFSKRFPRYAQAYKAACRDGSLAIGKVFVYTDTTPTIVAFPSKDDWRQPSRIEYIEAGLEDLDKNMQELDIQTVAMPALGCGLGGLDYEDVRDAIFQHLQDSPVHYTLLRPW